MNSHLPHFGVCALQYVPPVQQCSGVVIKLKWLFQYPKATLAHHTYMNLANTALHYTVSRFDMCSAGSEMVDITVLSLPRVFSSAY